MPLVIEYLIFLLKNLLRQKHVNSFLKRAETGAELEF